MPATPARRWHLVQHGFADLHSHYYKEATCWNAALNGQDWIGYASVHLPQPLADELRLLPCFTLPPDGQLDPDPVSREVTDYLWFSSVFAKHCEQHLTPRLSGNDVVLLTYCTQRELYGAALWLQTLPVERRPMMAFVFHLPDLQWQIAPDRSQISGSISAWRHAANQLAEVLPASRRVIGSTTPALARCLTQVLAQPVHPLPLVAPPLLDPDAGRPAARYDVVLPGEFRWEKGAGMVESILLGLARQRPDLRVSLQVRDQEQAQALVQSLRQQQFAASLDIVYGALDVAAYAQRLGAARLALLPYQPQRYALRCSGVAFECFMHGIPVVAPAGTWIADQIEAGLATGVLFHDWESDAIAQATLQALNQLDTLGVTARRLAPGWASQGGATPMLSRICALLGLQ